MAETGSFQTAKGNRPSFRTEKKMYPQSASFKDLRKDASDDPNGESIDALSGMPESTASPMMSKLKKTASMLGIASPSASRKTLIKKGSGSKKGLVDKARRSNRQIISQGSPSDAPT